MKGELEGGGLDETYEIVQKASAPGSAPIAKKEIERIGSMWSLRKGRSVRLQQWGTWICYEDQNVGSTFWYASEANLERSEPRAKRTTN